MNFYLTYNLATHLSVSKKLFSVNQLYDVQLYASHAAVASHWPVVFVMATCQVTTNFRYKFEGFPWSLISSLGPEALPLTSSAEWFLDWMLPVQADWWLQAVGIHRTWTKNWSRQLLWSRNLPPLRTLTPRFTGEEDCVMSPKSICVV